MYYQKKGVYEGLHYHSTPHYLRHEVGTDCGWVSGQAAYLWPLVEPWYVLVGILSGKRPPAKLFVCSL